MASPPPDKERRAHLEGVRRREPDALARFFEERIDHVYALAVRLLGSREAAEDATQEVFLRVHRFADRLDPDRDPAPWLRKVTANVCRDVWRSPAHRFATKAVPLDSEEHPTVTPASPLPDPAVVPLAPLGQHRVAEAIAQLPEDLREVVILRDGQGMRHEEIAEIVGASHAAVRKRYSRAIARLGELLKGVLE
ncbi:RNA polymerase sigma factor [bacterium]|nr:RNA polymerase sigma factor [bacterium]